MIRWLVIIALALGIYVFLASLGGGLGYASGGGEVRILSSWSEAHSEDGQAIAVYGDVENLNASNSPTPTPTAKVPSRLQAFAPMLGLLLVAFFVIVYFFIRFMPYMVDGKANEHQTTKSANTSSRSYGPE